MTAWKLATALPFHSYTRTSCRPRLRVSGASVPRTSSEAGKNTHCEVLARRTLRITLNWSASSTSTSSVYGTTSTGPAKDCAPA